MSWVWPRYTLTSGFVVDVDEFNENMSLYASEMNGGLNEQNFQQGIMADIIAAGACETDIMARTYAKQTKVDPHAAVSSMEAVPHGTRWVGISASEKSIVSRGGPALVIISFQIHCPTIPSGMSGLNFAVEVDGAISANTLLGTGDQSNDYLDTAYGATVGGGEVQYDYGTSPSFLGAQEPKQVVGTVYLTPGPHTIRLAARNLFTVQAAQAQYISQCETIVLELWA